MTSAERDYIAVIDFGGQYAHLIAKRVRHLGVYARVFSPMVPLEEVSGAKGIILSGGPESVTGPGAVPFNTDLLQIDRPLLGLCYGHQLLAHHLGGGIQHFDHGEFGRTTLHLESGHPSPLLQGVDGETEVWMSHGDTVVAPPPKFEVLGHTALCPVAAMGHADGNRFGLQFHPEVTDTRQGRVILANFLDLTGAARGWSMEAFVGEALESVRAQVGERNVLMFLSGGVDSTVAFTLLTRALGSERLKGLLIDNGFLRKDEARAILARYEELGLKHVEFLDASETFLAALAGRTDPQLKRQAVGETFLTVREDWLAGQSLDPNHWLLGQGTLYPDIIESGGSDHAEVIKWHHNRVERIEEMLATGHVVEPLAELYKDEVRALGTALGLPDDIVWRHPFPGPGLSINVLCMDGDEKFPEIEEAQEALGPLLEGTGFVGRPLPVRSVGVQGDSRTYTPPVALAGPRDWDALDDTSTRITNNLRSVNRVVTLLATRAGEDAAPDLSPGEVPVLLPRQAYCTPERLALLREADHLATATLQEAGLMREVFQLLVILLPLVPGSAGNDGNDSEEGLEIETDAIVLRPVASEDVMTARFARIPWPVLEPLAEKLIGLPGIRAVFFDVTHKPPATFGWE